MPLYANRLLGAVSGGSRSHRQLQLVALDHCDVGVEAGAVSDPVCLAAVIFFTYADHGGLDFLGIVATAHGNNDQGTDGNSGQRVDAVDFGGQFLQLHGQFSVLGERMVVLRQQLLAAGQLDLGTAGGAIASVARREAS